jgi:hypothetical protein
MSESDTYLDMVEGVLPVQPLQGYGVVRLGPRPAYGIATDVYRQSQDPTVAGWVDWLFGGFEDEDVKASTGTSSSVMADQMNEDRRKADDLLSRLVNQLPGGEVPPPGPDWKKLALVVGGLGAAYLVWAKVIEPRIAKGGA